MKKLLFILLVVSLTAFYSCDDNEHTDHFDSFVIHNSTTSDMKITSYRDGDSIQFVIPVNESGAFQTRSLNEWFLDSDNKPLIVYAEINEFELGDSLLVFPRQFESENDGVIIMPLESVLSMSDYSCRVQENTKSTSTYTFTFTDNTIHSIVDFYKSTYGYDIDVRR